MRSISLHAEQLVRRTRPAQHSPSPPPPPASRVLLREQQGVPALCFTLSAENTHSLYLGVGPRNMLILTGARVFCFFDQRSQPPRPRVRRTKSDADVRIL